MLTKDGTPAYTKVFKSDSKDQDGKPIWILSVRMDWTGQNLSLINDVIQSGLWYIDCDEEGKIENVNWSHKFRQMLGYDTEEEFPNQLESWSDLLYPEDKESILHILKEAIADTTNQIKYHVKYRLQMRDGEYQWFEAIVKMMNGHIDVDSELGKESKFKVTIFLKLRESEKETIEELMDLPVLVVDDDLDCCESAVDILQEIGIKGEWVTSGEEAVECVVDRHERRDDFFAIIMDWKMPGRFEYE